MDETCQKHHVSFLLVYFFYSVQASTFFICLGMHLTLHSKNFNQHGSKRIIKYSKLPSSCSQNSQPFDGHAASARHPGCPRRFPRTSRPSRACSSLFCCDMLISIISISSHLPQRGLCVPRLSPCGSGRSMQPCQPSWTLGHVGF